MLTCYSILFSVGQRRVTCNQDLVWLDPSSAKTNLDLEEKVLYAVFLACMGVLSELNRKITLSFLVGHGIFTWVVIQACQASVLSYYSGRSGGLLLINTSLAQNRNGCSIHHVECEPYSSLNNGVQKWNILSHMISDLAVCHRLLWCKNNNWKWT